MITLIDNLTRNCQETVNSYGQEGLSTLTRYIAIFKQPYCIYVPYAMHTYDILYIGVSDIHTISYFMIYLEFQFGDASLYLVKAPQVMETSHGHHLNLTAKPRRHLPSDTERVQSRETGCDSGYKSAGLIKPLKGCNNKGYCEFGTYV